MLTGHAMGMKTIRKYHARVIIFTGRNGCRRVNLIIVVKLLFAPMSNYYVK